MMMTSSTKKCISCILVAIITTVVVAVDTDDTNSNSATAEEELFLAEDPFQNGTRTYYEVFDVDPSSCTDSQVKRAYRKLAVKYHPDKVQGDAAVKSVYERIFVKIVVAFETLTNEKARQDYDEMVKVGVYEYDVSAWMRKTRGYSDGDLAREARERYQRYEEAEKRAFWLSIVGTFVVVVLPILYVLQDMNKRRKSRAQVTKESLADKRMQQQRDRESTSARKAAQAAVMAKARAEQAEEREQLMAQQHTTKNMVSGAFVPSSSSSSSASAAAAAVASSKKTVIRKDEWTMDELSALAKAVAKFPGGTANRWERVAEVVNAAGNGVSVRHVKDVIRTAQEIKMQAVVGSGGVGNNDTNTTPAPAPPAATTPPATVASVVVDDEWSTEQQLQLEQALKTYPSSNKERWNLIAKDVAGKTKKQCVARFKFIKQRLQASKQS